MQIVGYQNKGAARTLGDLLTAILGVFIWDKGKDPTL